MRKYLLHILIISVVLLSSYVLHCPLEGFTKSIERVPYKSIGYFFGEKPPALSDKPESFTDPVSGMEFMLVDGGCFQMGDRFGQGDDDEKPVHEVCVSDFYIGKYEVTQGEWEAVMGNNPSHFKNGRYYPVECVSWNDVQEFIGKLNLKTGGNYRLPTEAEWEYAAWSGVKREMFWDTEIVLQHYAWWCGNADGKTHPVGRLKPNGLGIYDMMGNVWEWVQDIYHEEAYKKHERNNPVYTGSGFRRVDRGGGWSNCQNIMRASCRNSLVPNSRYFDLGFRLARTP